MPKRSRSTTRARLFIFAAIGFLIAALAIQALLIWKLYARTDQLKTQELKTILVDAVRNLNTEPAVDPQTGRRYLPAYRLVLPAKLESRVYYRDHGEPAYILLADASNQSQAITKIYTAQSQADIFKQVEVVQKCSRQIVLSLDVTNPEASGDTLTLKSTKKLKDGRTAYLYQNDCPYGAEPILRSLSQIDSF